MQNNFNISIFVSFTINLIMNNKRYFTFLISLLAIFTCQFSSSQSLPTTPFTIIIDPGHGGKDQGASNYEIKEKDIVLAIGIKLNDYIQKNMPNTRIIMTRDKDVFVPLHQRVEIANTNKADLFISIHANYYSASSIYGSETFVLGLHGSDENLEVAQTENSVILMEDDYSSRYEGFDPNSPESYIMFEMVQGEYLDQSISLASLIQNQFKDHALRKDRGVKQAGFLILKQTSMPSIIIETGFLSNPTEAQYLNSDKGQDEVASAIYKALTDYEKTHANKSEFKLVAQEKSMTIDNANSAQSISENKDEIVSNHEQNEIKIFFCVQIAASYKKVDTSPSNWRYLKNVFIREQNGMYKYLYGQVKSYNEVKNIKIEARKKFPNAFIVALEDDNLVPLKNVLNK